MDINIKLENKNRIISASILVILCICYNIITSKRFYTNEISGDQKLYHSIALGILECKNSFNFYDQNFDIGTDVTPYFPSIVAASYAIAGVEKRNFCNLNIVLNCFIIIIIYFTFCLIKMNWKVSFLFSLAYLVYYPMWKMNFSILMEVTTVFLLSLVIFTFFWYLNVIKQKYLYLTVAIFSTLVLVNNRFVVLLLFFLFFLLIIAIKKGHELKRKFIFPFLIVLIIITPWFFRQYIEYKKFVLFTPLWHNVIVDKLGILEKININTASSLYEGGTAIEPLNYEDYINSMKNSIADDQQSRLNAFSRQKFEEVKSKHYPKENIYIYRFKRYFNLYNRDFHFEGPSDFRLIPPSSKIYLLVQLLILLPIFILSLFAFIVSIFKHDLKIIFLNILFFSHLILHVIIHYNARYRLTILPVLIIMAGYGFSELIRLYKIFLQRKFDYKKLTSEWY